MKRDGSNARLGGRQKACAFDTRRSQRGARRYNLPNGIVMHQIRNAFGKQGGRRGFALRMPYSSCKRLSTVASL